MYPLIQENEFVHMTETFWSMRDGVKLYTQIIVPAGKEKCPIVLMRSPYDEAHNGKPHDISKYNTYSHIIAGFAIVNQHVRGTGDSEGIIDPWRQERNDGLDTLEHIRKLSCYNGEILLYGGSYCAGVFMSILDVAGDDVKAAALHVCSSNTYDRYYSSGCMSDIGCIDWWVDRMKIQGADYSMIHKRPYKDVAKRVTGIDIPEYTGILMNDRPDDPYWKQFYRDYCPEKWKIPILFSGGWYDFYLSGMEKMWGRLPEETRKKSAFLIGPWPHATKLPKVQHYPHPGDADRPKDFATSWFHSVLENKQYPYGECNRLTYYSMGDSGWRDSMLPKLSGSVRRLYFSETALTDMPGPQTSISYSYDPEVPVTCFRHRDVYPAHEAGTVEGVLSFYSEPFTEKESFFGHHRWCMEVSSDCEDTAFFMRIYLEENGISYNLTQIMTSLSWHFPDYKPGQKVLLDLKTPLMAFTVRKGCRLRVDIASNDGQHVPHANVKGYWADVTQTKVAKNSVYVGNGFIELDREELN